MDTITRRPKFKDSFDLGRAMAIIDGLLHWPNDEGTRELAEKFLAEMKGENDPA